MRISQLGIILNGTSIIDTIPGGPGFNSRQLVPGDVIMKIDGVSVTPSNINTAIVGNDVTGTPVVLTVAKGGLEACFILHFMDYAPFHFTKVANFAGTSCQCANHANGI
jgi:C-terminal processing protease CtpA/Prc